MPYRDYSSVDEYNKAQREDAWSRELDHKEEQAKKLNQEEKPSEKSN